MARKEGLVGKKKWKAAALEACAHNDDPCMSLTAQASCGSLPRMSGGQEEHLTAVVDTGSTHTLIACNCIDQLGIALHAKGNTDVLCRLMESLWLFKVRPVFGCNAKVVRCACHQSM